MSTLSGLATAALLVLTGSAVAEAPLRPDLVETSISVSQTGASLRMTDVVRNRGAATAPRSTTGYFVAHVRIGVRPIASLPRGALSRGAVRMSVPSSIAPGFYRVVVCADIGHRIRESNERNNCLATSTPIEVIDRTPPTFAGLTSATTCIPGPSGGGTRSSSYHLAWDPAADNATPASHIVYDVYMANTPGGERFAAPTYTTPVGASSFATPPLPDDKPYYFVVRARDQAGNHDANSVERAGVNLCV